MKDGDEDKKRTGICLGWCGKPTEGFYCTGCQRKKTKAERRFGSARDMIHIPRREQQEALMFERSNH